MKPDIAIPPVTCELIREALRGMDGVRFERRDACPHCGGAVHGYDFKKKRFATVMIDGRSQNIYVDVKRYRCEECGRLSYADGPFYPDTRVGLPVVDLCVCLGRTMPFNRVATTLREMDVAIDRGTIRNYACRGLWKPPSFQMFRLELPFSIINLGIQMIRKADDRPMTGDEAFAAMGYDPERWDDFLRTIPPLGAGKRM